MKGLENSWAMWEGKKRERTKERLGHRKEAEGGREHGKRKREGKFRENKEEEGRWRKRGREEE